MSEINENWYSIEQKDKHCNCEPELKELKKEVEALKTLIKDLRTENFKMMNRMLEAEVCLERTKNSLLRNHIPFPFSISPLAKKF